MIGQFEQIEQDEHDAGTAVAKLPLAEDGVDTILRLGRWMRIVGTIQMAIGGMVMLFLLLGSLGGAMVGGVTGLLIMLIPVVGVGVWLLQGLRTQAAGEQLKNLGEAHEVDYLELVFVRLRTVFILDIIVALALGANGIF
jgi:hypothetical protein